MHDAKRMSAGKRIEDLQHDRAGLLRVQTRAVLEKPGEACAPDILHHQIWGAVIKRVVEERDDVRMYAAAGRLRLAAESREHFGAVLPIEQVRAKQLDSDIPVDFWIMRLVDDSHRPVPENTVNSVSANPLRQVFAHADPMIAAREGGSRS